MDGLRKQDLPAGHDGRCKAQHGDEPEVPLHESVGRNLSDMLNIVFEIQADAYPKNLFLAHVTHVLLVGHRASVLWRNRTRLIIELLNRMLAVVILLFIHRHNGRVCLRSTHDGWLMEVQSAR
jgi:hypothetical protein